MALIEDRIERIEQCLGSLVDRLCPPTPSAAIAKTVLGGLLKRRPKKLTTMGGLYKEDCL